MSTLQSIVTALQQAHLRIAVGSRRQGDRGASLVEYALLVALIALVCVVAIAFFAEETSDTFSRVGRSVQAAAG